MAKNECLEKLTKSVKMSKVDAKCIKKSNLVTKSRIKNGLKRPKIWLEMAILAKYLFWRFFLT